MRQWVETVTLDLIDLEKITQQASTSNDPTTRIEIKKVGNLIVATIDRSGHPVNSTTVYQGGVVNRVE